MLGSYLWSELRHRTRQAVLIALGLALGVGLVVTVSAASVGVNKAETEVLSGLYGIGTDITVSGPSALSVQRAQVCKPACTHLAPELSPPEWCTT
jgi:putative ABC transport system permease protein